ncbi:class I SAM-dependent DNA methyltransferase [Parasphingorhabdus sp.]|uniref:class I SAM-dependent DNA methyltransferase n=1 Tax=Parasphingorhabdus sp. TaxID=2709688 RepID=UPI003BAE4D63
MVQRNQLETAKRSTKAIYERQARVWDEGRSTSLYEKPWLDRFLSFLPPKGRLLDLGCGSGIPVAGYFLGKGYDLVGVDYADTMIALARQRYPEAEWPNADWIVQDITQLSLEGQFDGIYSWDGFFHLSIAEQRDVLPKLAKLVKAQSAMMLTVGTGEGEVTGTVGGETVYHASLSPEEYKERLSQYGFENVTFVAEDSDSLGRSVLLASGKRE